MERVEVDVLIVGAGLSGICAAHHLQTKCPGKSYAILEARQQSGGTWDLFRYPGIRSDSDMFTLGYSFKPWTHEKSIAAGESILAYVRDTARDEGIDRHIRYGMRVERAAWSTQSGRWTVEVRDAASGTIREFVCSFMFLCAGYYDYEAGYTPEFAGRERFQGRIVHPQHWPEDLNYDGKRVVVIGSGATAVTLVPEMAKRAGHVTMLQRSPTYIFAAPGNDVLASRLRKVLSPKRAYSIIRWKNVVMGMTFFAYCRRFPQQAKAFLVDQVRKQLKDPRDAKRHFTPNYNPWDQRLCLVPDGDLFQALNSGSASVVTDHIDSFTERGIKLRSGAELEADIIVTATGLNLKVLGGLSFNVDGAPVELSKTMTYKGMMLSDVPNMAYAMGYTNASWTLKCDLTAEYVCRLINHMDKVGVKRCVARRDPSVPEESMLDFNSGYVLRSIDEFPRQGVRAPWRLHQNYARDRRLLRHSPVTDAVMHFG